MNLNIELEVKKIESFINKNFNNLKIESINQKRFVKYAYFLEKIKNDLNKSNGLTAEFKENIDKSIINDILSLKKLILDNHKQP